MIYYYYYKTDKNVDKNRGDKYDKPDRALTLFDEYYYRTLTHVTIV